MSGERRRRRHRSALLGSFRTGLGRLRAHPLRLALVASLSIGLSWLVLTKSLPFALAPDAPDAALALNPGNPAALLAKARQLRARLIAQSGNAPEPAGTPGAGALLGRANTLSKLPKAESGGMAEIGGEREALRKKIGALATQVIAREPLNSEAYRLLAETADSPERVRSLMQEAVNRSRRESAALFWLLNDSFYRKDYRAALEYADFLLRTRPELSDYVFKYVSLIAEAQAGLPLVVQALAQRPGWRGQ